MSAEHSAQLGAKLRWDEIIGHLCREDAGEAQKCLLFGLARMHPSSRFVCMPAGTTSSQRWAQDLDA